VSGAKETLEIMRRTGEREKKKKTYIIGLKKVCHNNLTHERTRRPHPEQRIAAISRPRTETKDQKLGDQGVLVGRFSQQSLKRRVSQEPPDSHGSECRKESYGKQVKKAGDTEKPKGRPRKKQQPRG